MKRDHAEKQDNPLRDSWKPSDKAAEAYIDNPVEFDYPLTLAEDSIGPEDNLPLKTHGEPDHSEEGTET